MVCDVYEPTVCNYLVHIYGVRYSDAINAGVHCVGSVCVEQHVWRACVQFGNRRRVGVSLLVLLCVWLFPSWVTELHVCAERIPLWKSERCDQAGTLHSRSAHG